MRVLRSGGKSHYWKLRNKAGGQSRLVLHRRSSALRLGSSWGQARAEMTKQCSDSKGKTFPNFVHFIANNIITHDHRSEGNCESQICRGMGRNHLKKPCQKSTHPVSKTLSSSPSTLKIPRMLEISSSSPQRPQTGSPRLNGITSQKLFQS